MICSNEVNAVEFVGAVGTGVVVFGPFTVRGCWGSIPYHLYVICGGIE